MRALVLSALIAPVLLTPALLAPALADPFETIMTNADGAILDITAVTPEGFDFGLASAPCPEGETTCLVVYGHATRGPKGYTYVDEFDPGSRIFFADTPEGLRVVQTLGDLGAGTANRAAKSLFVGDYVPDPQERVTEAEYHAFRSPTGNIGCLFIRAEATEVRCDLAEFSAPARPAECELDWGGAYWVGAWSPAGQALCHGDTVLDPGAEVLDYGSSLAYDGVTCWSEQSGMTCENDQGHGFSVSRRAQSAY